MAGSARKRCFWGLLLAYAAWLAFLAWQGHS